MKSQLSQTIVKISPFLEQLVEELASTVTNVVDLLNKIQEQAKLENLTAQETRALIFAALSKRGLATRTIYKYLPSDLKDNTKSANRSRPNKNSVAPNATKKVVDDDDVQQDDGDDDHKLTIREKDELEGRDDDDQEPESAVAQWRALAEKARAEPSIEELQGRIAELEYQLADAQKKAIPDMLTVRIYVPSFFPYLLAAKNNNKPAYLHIKNFEVYKVESESEHQALEVKA